MLTRENFYKTDEDAFEATTAIYADICNSNIVGVLTGDYGYELLNGVLKNLLSDDVWPGEGSHGGDSWALNEFTFDSNNPFITQYFTKVYKIIGKCNLVLDNVDDSTPLKRQMRAEAKVIRAWMYFDLGAMWGNPPIVDHLLDATETAQPNSDPDVLWTFIENDLNEAINSGALTCKSDIGDTNIYRVSKSYAQALLGKAYLWHKKYKESAQAFEDLISSNLFDLFPGEYSDMLQPQYESNCEMIFETSFVDDPANPGACFNFWPAFINNMRSDVWNYGDNKYGIYDGGFLMLLPRGSLYDAFIEEEGPDGYRLNQTMRTYQQMRADGYSLIPGVRIPNEGYVFFKNRVTYASLGSTSQYDCINNTRWMRYGEVLLCAAEANLMAENQSKADEYLNKVRSRAKLQHKTATLEAIKTEKRLELCMEGCRFLDLIRWGDAAEVLKDQGKVFPWIEANGTVTWDNSNTQYGFKAGRNERLPFPQTDIVSNKNLIQNPGY